MIKKVDTPCYLFDRDDFKHNISMFMNALDMSFNDNWILGYSFKTNYLPFVLSNAKDCGCYAEVVSEKEYYLAKQIGFDEKKIIYNGPIKSKSTFLEAIINGGIVNIDSKREIEWLRELPQEKKYNVGVRVNFDLESELPGHTLMGEDGGRFGFSDDNGELHRAINSIKDINNVNLCFLHMHVSSKTKSSDIYKHLVRKACMIMNREELAINYIDLGGSFFGGGDDGTAYQKYVRAIKEALDECNIENMGIIVEPGASVIASSISYVAEIVDDKYIKQNRYLITDGSRLHVDPFFTKTNYNYKLISNGEVTDECQNIVGFTCMEKDRIIKIEGDRKLKIGDRIVFNTVGSYTMCMNSDFISSEPRVYAVSDGKYYLVRKEKDISSYFMNSTLEEV